MSLLAPAALVLRRLLVAVGGLVPLGVAWVLVLLLLLLLLLLVLLRLLLLLLLLPTVSNLLQALDVHQSANRLGTTATNGHLKGASVVSRQQQ